MPAPTSWQRPLSYPTVTIAINGAWMIDAWVVANHITGGTLTVGYRRSADPSGEWSEASTFPAYSTGYTQGNANRHVASDGSTTYAVAVPIAKSANPDKAAILYTTDLAGTWSIVERTMTVSQGRGQLAYGDGYWVVCGRDNSSNAIMDYATSLGGSWTSSTSAAAGSQYHSIAYGDGYWVRILRDATTYTIEYATTLGGTWSTSFSGTLGSDFTPSRVRHILGYWVIAGFSGTGSSLTGEIRYLSDITSGSYATSACGFTTGVTSQVNDIAHNGTYWIACGQVATGPIITYAVGPTPSGTFSRASQPLTSGGMTELATHAGMSLCTSGSGAYPVVNKSGADSTLRQRQSPKRTPSRVRGVDLRQRQTPTIR